MAGAVSIAATRYRSIGAPILDEKSYKPTFEAFKLGTMISDKSDGGAS